MSTLNLRSALLSLIVAAGAIGVAAQSSDQNYPTPVTTSELRGTVRARAMGDSRVTTHFYAFHGQQGDIFINVVTRNFDGDIDVFTANDLRPLTKIVVYSDAGTTETGRIVYLRKGEHLLLRVEGRSPDDNAAAYTIKFAGSFVALSPENGVDTGVPTVTTADTDGIKLNSVGAVTGEPDGKPDTPARPSATAKASEPKADSPSSVKATEPPVETKAPPRSETAGQPTTKVRPPKPPKVTVSEPSVLADPLASVFLTVLLKNGRAIVKPMSEVSRFSTDKGVITIVSKDGVLARYLIADVSKVTIE